MYSITLHVLQRDKGETDSAKGSKKNFSIESCACLRELHVLFRSNDERPFPTVLQLH